MVCEWRNDIDARVEGAPDDLVWRYQEMLAGTDAVRYVMHAEAVAADEQRLRTLLLKVVAAQFQEDAKIKS